eukprot:TRINITY_DN3408_c0_g1_i3.p1 TRINITY_DN3408_c0_g1~~TRINITY_DN3408_c0_g1_i3.p1  ORF type:complete len:1320 (+),score=173.92 TRINITY_DN3408_c0_g1_i3:133-4092(+)
MRAKVSAFGVFVAIVLNGASCERHGINDILLLDASIRELAAVRSLNEELHRENLRLQQRLTDRANRQEQAAALDERINSAVARFEAQQLKRNVLGVFGALKKDASKDLSSLHVAVDRLHHADTKLREDGSHVSGFDAQQNDYEDNADYYSKGSREEPGGVKPNTGSEDPNVQQNGTTSPAPPARETSPAAPRVRVDPTFGVLAVGFHPAPIDPQPAFSSTVLRQVDAQANFSTTGFRPAQADPQSGNSSTLFRTAQVDPQFGNASAMFYPWQFDQQYGNYSATFHPAGARSAQSGPSVATDQVEMQSAVIAVTTPNANSQFGMMPFATSKNEQVNLQSAGSTTAQAPTAKAEQMFGGTIAVPVAAPVPPQQVEQLLTWSGANGRERSSPSQSNAQVPPNNTQARKNKLRSPGGESCPEDCGPRAKDIEAQLYLMHIDCEVGTRAGGPSKTANCVHRMNEIQRSLGDFASDCFATWNAPATTTPSATTHSCEHLLGNVEQHSKIMHAVCFGTDTKASVAQCDEIMNMIEDSLASLRGCVDDAGETANTTMFSPVRLDNSSAHYSVGAPTTTSLKMKNQTDQPSSVAGGAPKARPQGFAPVGQRVLVPGPQYIPNMPEFSTTPVPQQTQNKPEFPPPIPSQSTNRLELASPNFTTPGTQLAPSKPEIAQQVPQQATPQPKRTEFATAFPNQTSNMPGFVQPPSQQAPNKPDFGPPLPSQPAPIKPDFTPSPSQQAPSQPEFASTSSQPAPYKPELSSTPSQQPLSNPEFAYPSSQQTSNKPEFAASTSQQAPNKPELSPASSQQASKSEFISTSQQAPNKPEFASPYSQQTSSRPDNASTSFQTPTAANKPEFPSQFSNKPEFSTPVPPRPPNRLEFAPPLTQQVVAPPQRAPNKPDLEPTEPQQAANTSEVVPPVPQQSLNKPEPVLAFPNSSQAGLALVPQQEMLPPVPFLATPKPEIVLPVPRPAPNKPNFTSASSQQAPNKPEFGPPVPQPAPNKSEFTLPVAQQAPIGHFANAPRTTSNTTDSVESQSSGPAPGDMQLSSFAPSPMAPVGTEEHETPCVFGVSPLDRQVASLSSQRTLEEIVKHAQHALEEARARDAGVGDESEFGNGPPPQREFEQGHSNWEWKVLFPGGKEGKLVRVRRDQQAQPNQSVVSSVGISTPSPLGAKAAATAQRREQVPACARIIPVIERAMTSMSAACSAWDAEVKQNNGKPKSLLHQEIDQEGTSLHHVDYAVHKSQRSMKVNEGPQEDEEDVTAELRLKELPTSDSSATQSIGDAALLAAELPELSLSDAPKEAPIHPVSPRSGHRAKKRSRNH